MGAGPIRLIFARTPDTHLPIWLVDCPSLFQRPGGPYRIRTARTGLIMRGASQCSATSQRDCRAASFWRLARRHCPCQRLADGASSSDIAGNSRPKARYRLHDT